MVIFWRTAGCTAFFASMAALTAVNHRLLAPARVGGSIRLTLAISSACLVTLGLATFLSVARGEGRSERSPKAVLRRARAGELPEDGQPAIVTGSVRPVGEVLTAPLSGIKCVYYEYRMYLDEYSVYSGYGSRAFEIDTRISRVPVHGVPSLVRNGYVPFGPFGHKGSEPCVHVSPWAAPDSGHPAIGRARELIQTAPFESGRHVWEQDARHDWKSEAMDKDPAELYLLEETVLPVDAVASVYGTWSAERGAMLQDQSTGQVEDAVRDNRQLIHGPLVALGPPEALVSVISYSSSAALVFGGTLAIALGAWIVWHAL